MPEPIGYIVYWRHPSGIPGVLADARPDGGGTIYTREGVETRLAELHRHGMPEYRIGAVYPVTHENAPAPQRVQLPEHRAYGTRAGQMATVTRIRAVADVVADDGWETQVYLDPEHEG